ncbi:MAG: DUF5320 domain-containing protein [Thermacetogeniaceae bacterium]
MPRGDGTGPMGLGPMTGRAAGYCAGFPAPGFMNPYGFGRWWGFGRGWNWRWAMPLYPYPFYSVSPEQEATFLKRQAEILQEGLKSIEKRLKELGKSADE